MSNKRQKHIYIFDDDQGVGGLARRMESVLQEAASGFTTHLLNETKFKEDIDVLRQRQMAARDGNEEKKETSFDKADILVVDYFLEDFTDGFVTGEQIAYLARCYSECKLIIAVNQFARRGSNYFDLTLKGAPQSFADLNLTVAQLANQGLWRESWTKPIFRPWYWPVIPQALADYEKRLMTLKKNGALKRPIPETLGLPEAVADGLPRAYKAFLGKHDDVNKVTFEEFVNSSSNGLRGKDEPRSDEQIARIAAARVAKWLEEIVLTSQHVLVDAPHLAERFPSLLKRAKGRSASFDKTATLGSQADAGIDLKVTEQARWLAKHWLSRPAWIWELLVGNEFILEVARPWEAEPSSDVFCEDVSRFLPRAAVREFIADLPGPFTRRYVVETGTQEGRKYATALQDVEYDPALRLSL